MTLALTTPVIEAVGPVLADSQHAFDELSKLNWVSVSPVRLEYFASRTDKPYQYATKDGIREYQPMPISPMLNLIWLLTEAELSTNFDMCFLNQYQDGTQSIGWHSDDNPSNDMSKPIAIVSFGAERQLQFRRKGSETVDVTCQLRDNTMVIMPEYSQLHWEHRILKDVSVNAPRISLTFRGSAK